MPYILVSCEFLLDVGPTRCGDEDSDPELMKLVEAELTKELGNTFSHYVTRLSPRVVLNRLETKGFKVIAMAGPGQTCVWTLYKPDA